MTLEVTQGDNWIPSSFANITELQRDMQTSDAVLIKAGSTEVYTYWFYAGYSKNFLYRQKIPIMSKNQAEEKFGIKIRGN